MWWFKIRMIQIKNGCRRTILSKVVCASLEFPLNVPTVMLDFYQQRRNKKKKSWKTNPFNINSIWQVWERSQQNITFPLIWSTLRYWDQDHLPRKESTMTWWFPVVHSSESTAAMKYRKVIFERWVDDVIESTIIN